MKFLGEPRSGSFANQTSSRNRYGQYVRVRSGRGGVPVHSIAPAVAAWQALTIDQQAAWWRWASQLRGPDSLGQEHSLGGPQRFYQAYWYGTILRGVSVSTAPSVRASTRLVNCGITLTGTDFVTATGAVDGDGPAVVPLDITFQGASTGTTRPPGRGTYWRFLGAVEIVTPPGVASTSISFTSLTKGRVWVRARAVGPDFVPGPHLMAGPVTVS